MTDHSMLFSDDMARALWEGRKTQDRRPLKKQPSKECAGFQRVFKGPPFFEARDRSGKPCYAFPHGKDSVSPYPVIPYAPGDRIRVQETFARRPDGSILYRATDAAPAGQKWAPNIHMLPSVSRMFLTVTDVRVQRLQDISEEDAREQGVNGGCLNCGMPGPCNCLQPTPSHCDGFAEFWMQTYGPDSWNANPWVMALTFTVHRQNIDQGE